MTSNLENESTVRGESSVSEVTGRILADAFGVPIRLGPSSSVGGDRLRASVLRFPILEASEGLPRSVVVKVQGGGTEERDEEAVEERFGNEVAALAFLSETDVTPAVAPKLYGFDRQSGIIVLEDVGPGTSLADLLLGHDPDDAERGLKAYARTMGKLHAVTVGKRAEYEAIRGGDIESRFAWRRVRALAEKDPSAFLEACHDAGVSVAPDFAAEAERLQETLEAPTFLAFNLTDACPDNNLIAGATVRFFDLEFAGFRHALMDGSYLRLPFPSCWCMGRIPTEIQAQAEGIYRAELVKGVPEAGDDRVFSEAMLAACAHWTLRSVAWTLQTALVEDEEWGLATQRQRHVYRLERLAEQTQETGHFTAIGQTCASLAHNLRARWPKESAEMPVYPAFAT